MSQYGDLWDEDTQTLYEDDSTRCPHGTYTGTPGGPDFMCGRCEMGDDDDIGALVSESDYAKLTALLADGPVTIIVDEEHICEGENCSLCPRCYKATGNDVCAYTCEHGV